MNPIDRDNPFTGAPVAAGLLDLSRLDPVDALCRKLAEARESRELLEGKPGTSSAVVALHKLESELVLKIADARAAPPPAPQPRPIEEKTDAELVALLVEAVAELPDGALEALEDAIVLRRSGRPPSTPGTPGTVSPGAAGALPPSTTTPAPDPRRP